MKNIFLLLFFFGCNSFANENKSCESKPMDPSISFKIDRGPAQTNNPKVTLITRDPYLVQIIDTENKTICYLAKLGCCDAAATISCTPLNK